MLTALHISGWSADGEKRGKIRGKYFFVNKVYTSAWTHAMIASVRVKISWRVKFCGDRKNKANVLKNPHLSVTTSTTGKKAVVLGWVRPKLFLDSER